jgi:hypothetical protein
MHELVMSSMPLHVHSCASLVNRLTTSKLTTRRDACFRPLEYPVTMLSSKMGATVCLMLEDVRLKLLPCRWALEVLQEILELPSMIS